MNEYAIFLLIVGGEWFNTYHNIYNRKAIELFDANFRECLLGIYSFNGEIINWMRK